MKYGFEIKEKFSRGMIKIGTQHKYVHLPTLTATLKNPDTNYVFPASQTFLVDTGASISVIGNPFTNFFKSLTPEVEKAYIQYGTGAPKQLPIYKVIFIWKSQEIEVKVAHDKDCPFLLLGHHEFLENMSFTLIHSREKTTRIAK